MKKCFHGFDYFYITYFCYNYTISRIMIYYYRFIIIVCLELSENATNVSNLKSHQPYHIWCCIALSDYEDCFVTIKY